MVRLKMLVAACLLCVTAAWGPSIGAARGTQPPTRCNVAPAPLDVPRLTVPLPYTYLLHVPEGLPDRPVPLMLALHGLLGNGAQFARQSEWTRFADEGKFIVAFPTGPLRWDATEGSRDVDFLRRVVTEIAAQRCVDARRIWVTGHSYGGFMTQRLACEAGDLFAAGAVVSGGNITMPVVGGPCDAGASGGPEGYEPVPLGFWHGTADAVVPYEQGRKSFDAWAQRYECTTVTTRAHARYGAVQVASDCRRPDVTERERPGRPFRLRFHTYDAHRHGYPDGCGGNGELSLDPCRPDPSAWPTLDWHQREILAFLRANPRRDPAPGVPAPPHTGDR